MKKLFVVLLLALFLAPNFAVAGNWTSAPIPAGNGTNISTLSNKVTLNTLGNALTYAAITGHESGNKLFGTSSSDTKIYNQTVTTVTVSAPGASDSSAFSSGWTAL